MGRRARAAHAALIALGAFTSATGAASAQDATDIEQRLSTEPAFEDHTPRFDYSSEPGPADEGVPFLSTWFGAARTSMVMETAALAGQPDAGRCARPVHREDRTISGSFGGTHTTNAAQAPNDEEADTSLAPKLSFSWSRRSAHGNCADDFDPNWRFTGTIEGGVEDYLDDEGSDSGSAQVKFVYSHRLGTQLVGGDFSTRWNLGLTTATGYSGIFDEWLFTTYRPTIGLAHIFQQDETGKASVAATLGYTYSNPEENSYAIGTLEFTRSFKNLAWLPNWTVSTGFSVSYRDYDDLQREDIIMTPSLGFERKWGGTALNINLQFTTRESNVDAKDYDAFQAPIMITLSHKY